MAKFAINASSAMLLPSLVQVSESISGSVVPLAMFLLQFCPFEPFQTSDYLCASTRKSEREMPKQDAYTDLTSAKTKPMMAKLFYIVKNQTNMMANYQ